MDAFKTAFALHRQGRLDEAARLYRSILAEAPDRADVQLLLGMIVLAQGDASEAEALLARSLARDPNNPAAYSVRGVALAQLGRFPDSLDAFNRALMLKPDYAEAFNDRGNVLRELGRPADALASFERAIALKPGAPDAYYNRGKTLHDLGRLEEALQSHERAIALKPDYAEAHNNRGVILLELTYFAEAIKSFTRVLEVKPGYAEAHLNRGLARLLTGDMARGWTDFEYRWQQKAYGSKRSGIEAPEWRGEDVSGRSILVYDEEGLGDTVQFCRYLPLLAARGARVSLLLRSNLFGLLRSLPGGIQLLAAIGMADRFDFQLPLLSLPQRFGTTLATVPAAAPYLAAAPERVERWASRIGTHGFKIGICWQGSPKAAIDIGRSLPLKEFAALARIPGVRLISLQKHHGLEQLRTLPPGMRVETLGEDFDSDADAFADTAAAMMNLDLVVSSDTSIAHVAGALGRPVWLALKQVPDWRWLADGETSPWYPTMRLFRQTTRGEWGPVFAAMAEALGAIVPRPD